MTSTDTPHLPDCSGDLHLPDLQPGAAAIVVAVDPKCRAATRLLDLGFTPGTRVSVVRRAPLGDPTEYELRGMRLCLRRGEAEAVHVRPA